MTPGKVICLDFVQAEQPVLWTVLVVDVFPMVDAVLAVTRAKGVNQEVTFAVGGHSFLMAGK